ncbi:MAG: hypothetical protein ACRCTD_15815 [Beijerinckiaceae bacterium]
MSVEKRRRVMAALWIGGLLMIWAGMLGYAGRDGLKPHDPSAAPLPHMIRK